MNASRLRLNSLMYHDIRMSRAGGRYSFTLGEFREHLRAIRGAVGRAPWVLGTASEPSGFALTFDDGGLGWLAAAEALREQGWKAFFFVITGVLGRPGELSKADVRLLASMGHVIGSHSVNHAPLFSFRDDDYIRREWSRSKAALEEILGRDVACASVPGGFYSDRVARAADAEGILHLFTSEPVARSWNVGRCRVLGRYALTKGMSGRAVARLTSGAIPQRVGRYLAWNFKKAVKAAVMRPALAFRARRSVP